MHAGDIAFLVVVIVRLFIPLVILKKPLFGGILSIIGDISDVFLLQAFGFGFFGEHFSYHQIDKLFDTWYLFLEFLVVLKWKDNLAKKTGTVLFLWRFAGFLVFEIFSLRKAFFFAPNIFEFFFLAYLIILKFNKDFKFNRRNLIVVLLIVGIPNIIKEYLMHFKYPDQTWDFLREKLFWWVFK